jgi:hypothetical protein
LFSELIAETAFFHAEAAHREYYLGKEEAQPQRTSEPRTQGSGLSGLALQAAYLLRSQTRCVRGSDVHGDELPCRGNISRGFGPPSFPA